MGPGHARLEMVVTQAMPSGVCHGGCTFTLAAFAYVCDSHGDRAVASEGSITYLRPGKVVIASSPSRKSARGPSARTCTTCG